jgi:HK97 family phage major capsid protein
MSDLLTRLQEQRLRAWDGAKAILDTADEQKRALESTEEAAWDKATEDITKLDKRMAEVIAAEKAAAEHDAAMRALQPKPKADETPEQRGADPLAETALEAELRSFLKGEKRAMAVTPDRKWRADEFRTLSKLTAGAGANTVKVSFYDQLVAHLIEVSGILQAGPTVLRTSTGEQIQVPKTTAHSSATLTAEAATIAASDPVFGQIPLDAYKYATLIQVSNELVNDTSVDLMGYLAMQAGRAAGNAFGTQAITGTGTNQPNGLATAATTGVTGGAGVTGAFTADNLIDLMFSVIAPYRSSPSCAWLMRDATLANVRKLKDTTNQYLWQPSIQVGVPDMLLGKPVYTDPNVAAVGLSARSVLFGDISQYFVRWVQDIRFERSDEFAFSSDLVTFRCILRADGDLVDTTGAVKAFVGNAA